MKSPHIILELANVHNGDVNTINFTGNDGFFNNDNSQPEVCIISGNVLDENMDFYNAFYNYFDAFGVPTLGLFASDLGLDEIEYRDIDNTINDIGPNGGPYTIQNYFNVNGSDGTNKARIVNLDIPTTIYGLQGIDSYQIKAKSIITSE